MGVGRLAPHRLRARYARALAEIPLPVRSFTGIDPAALTMVGDAVVAGRRLRFGVLTEVSRLWVAFAEDCFEPGTDAPEATRILADARDGGPSGTATETASGDGPSDAARPTGAMRTGEGAQTNRRSPETPGDTETPYETQAARPRRPGPLTVQFVLGYLTGLHTGTPELHITELDHLDWARQPGRAAAVKHAALRVWRSAHRECEG